MSKLTDLIPGILSGEYDDDLHAAEDAIKERRKVLNAAGKKRYELAMDERWSEAKAGEGVWWTHPNLDTLVVDGVVCQITYPDRDVHIDVQGRDLIFHRGSEAYQCVEHIRKELKRVDTFKEERP